MSVSGAYISAEGEVPALEVPVYFGMEVPPALRSDCQRT